MTVLFRGKHIDPISLWSNYVDFPANWNPGDSDEFSPLVVCPNPDHQTQKKHFQVNIRQATVHCFAHCGISGSYEAAIATIEGVTHRQARKFIFKHSRVGGTSPVRKRNRGAVKAVRSVDLEYDRFLPQSALAYLTSRGIGAEAIARFEIGWDSDSLRLVIPVKDERGRTRLLIKRTIKPRVEPRYLYTKGVERKALLMGIDRIDLGMVRSRGIVLVEGSLDKIVLDGYQIPPQVAILGSKLSEIQAKIIQRKRPAVVYTMFDADGAGVGATISVAQLIRGIPIKVCRYPKGKTDPAVLTGREAERSIERAITFSQFRHKAGFSLPKQPRRMISVGEGR